MHNRRQNLPQKGNRGGLLEASGCSHPLIKSGVWENFLDWMNLQPRLNSNTVVAVASSGGKLSGARGRVWRKFTEKPVLLCSWVGWLTRVAPDTFLIPKTLCPIRVPDSPDITKQKQFSMDIMYIFLHSPFSLHYFQKRARVWNTLRHRQYHGAIGVVLGNRQYLCDGLGNDVLQHYAGLQRRQYLSQI